MYLNNSSKSLLRQAILSLVVILALGIVTLTLVISPQTIPTVLGINTEK